MTFLSPFFVMKNVIRFLHSKKRMSKGRPFYTHPFFLVAFEQYREDIVLSQAFYQYIGESKLKEYDFVYIPHFGMKFDDKTLNNIYSFINEASQKYPDACYYQSYMNESDRKRIQFDNGNKQTYHPQIPNNYQRSYGGMLFKPSKFEDMSEFELLYYYTGRYDVGLQIHCEIDDGYVVVSNENVVDIPSINYFN